VEVVIAGAGRIETEYIDVVVVLRFAWSLSLGATIEL
jgi:hypothetical protein